MTWSALSAGNVKSTLTGYRIVYGKNISVWIDYIELRIRLNQFEMFVSILIHETKLWDLSSYFLHLHSFHLTLFHSLSDRYQCFFHVSKLIQTFQTDWVKSSTQYSLVIQNSCFCKITCILSLVILTKYSRKQSPTPWFCVNYHLAQTTVLYVGKQIGA